MRLRELRARAADPEPSTQAFGERANERRESLRRGVLEKNPVNVQARRKQLQYRSERDARIAKEAGE